MVRRRRLNNSMRALRAGLYNMTQAELAEKVGVTRQTIIAIEQAKYSPSLETAFLISEALGVPLTDVFAFEPGDNA